jgi:hypothetical protein
MMQNKFSNQSVLWHFALSLPDPYEIVKNCLQLPLHVPRQFVGSQVGRERESFAGS